MYTLAGSLTAAKAVSSFERVLQDESGSMEDTLHIPHTSRQAEGLCHNTPTKEQ